MKAIVEPMVRASRQYFVPEGLPGRDQLRAALEREENQRFWEALSPYENFFVFEVAPDQIEKAPNEFVTKAYCAAVAQLPADWWGSVWRPSSDTAARLMKVPGIEACLLGMLDDQSRVYAAESELATNADVNQLMVADIAAVFLAVMRDREYDVDAPLADRIAERASIKAAYAEP